MGCLDLRPLSTLPRGTFRGFTSRGKPLNRGRLTNSYYPPSLVERYMSSSYKSYSSAAKLLTFQDPYAVGYSAAPALWVNDEKGKIIAQYTDANTNGGIVTAIWDGKYIYTPSATAPIIYQFTPNLQVVNTYNLSALTSGITGMTIGKNYNIVSASTSANLQYIILDKNFNVINVVTNNNYPEGAAIGYFNGYHYILCSSSSVTILLAVDDTTGNIVSTYNLPAAGYFGNEYYLMTMTYANNLLYAVYDPNPSNMDINVLAFSDVLSLQYSYNIPPVPPPSSPSVNILATQNNLYVILTLNGILWTFTAPNINTLLSEVSTLAMTLAQVGKTTYTVYPSGGNTYLGEVDLNSGNVKTIAQLFNYVIYPTATIVLS